MKRFFPTLLTCMALLFPAASKAAETAVPLTTDNWNRMTCGVIAETADGIQISGADYRSGNVALTKGIFDFTRGSETFIKFMPLDPSYAAFGFGIWNVASTWGTTAWSWAGSTVIYSGVWHYLHITVNSDGTFTTVLSLDDYDSNGGSVLETRSGTLGATAMAKAKIGQLYGSIGDNYNGQATSLVVGEARTTAVPVTFLVGNVISYDFNDGMIPAAFTVTGDWSAADGSLQLSTTGNQTSTAATQAPNPVLVSFKVKTDIVLRSWGWDNGFNFGVQAFNGDWVDGLSWMTTSPNSCWLDVSFVIPEMGPQNLQWTYFEENYYSGYPSPDNHVVAVDDVKISCPPEKPYNGIDDDCNGYDLTIRITSAAYSKSKRTLTVGATSDLKANAALVVDGYGAMSWNRNQLKWTKTVSGVALTCPSTVTVSGPEGLMSADLTCGK